MRAMNPLLRPFGESDVAYVSVPGLGAALDCGMYVFGVSAAGFGRGPLPRDIIGFIGISQSNGSEGLGILTVATSLDSRVMTGSASWRLRPRVASGLGIAFSF